MARIRRQLCAAAGAADIRANREEPGQEQQTPPPTGPFALALLQQLAQQRTHRDKHQHENHSKKQIFHLNTPLTFLENSFMMGLRGCAPAALAFTSRAV